MAMMYYPKVTGERVYLSPVNPEDYEAYTLWINDPRVSENLGNAHRILSVPSERDFLERMAKNEGDGIYSLAIVRREDDMLLGNISLFDVKHVDRSAVLGLFIGEAGNRGRGYGSEAIVLMLRYGFFTLNLHNVMLSVYDFNERAIACYRRVGFREIGRRRQSHFVRGQHHDEILMDILSTEFAG